MGGAFSGEIDKRLALAPIIQARDGANKLRWFVVGHAIAAGARLWFAPMFNISP